MTSDNEFQSYNLLFLVTSVVSTFRPILEEKGIGIECAIDEYYVKGDQDIEKIFSILLDNSIKHSNCKNIKIFTEMKDEGRILITYEDDGVGLPVDYQNMINRRELYSKKPNSKGLVLVKELVQKYGGAITVSTRNQGKGTRYNIIMHLFDNKK